MPPEKVESVARGRVWSGEAAAGLGLVDRNGDLITAIDLARELAGFSEADGASVRLNMHKASPADILSDAFASAPAASGQAPAVGLLAPLIGEERAIAAVRELRRIARPHEAMLAAPVIVER